MLPAPPQTLAAIRAAFARGSEELAAMVPSREAGERSSGAASPDRLGFALGRQRARLLDELLTSLFALVAGSSSSSPARTASLAGVGGYGRGAVAFKSDIDVKLLTTDPRGAAELADALLYPLWDMGLSVGHQVVTVDELIDGAATDLPTATSLLDWRHVAGDPALSEALRQKSEVGLFAHSELPRFMARLEAEVAQRHERFGGSVYLLEPDVKNGAGGLRDLDVAFWAAKARYGVGELDELVRVGALVPREALEIRAAGETLWRIRNLLHAEAGRRSDRLTFDEQEAIAPLLGFGEGGEAVEHLMSEYYRTARAISRARGTVLARATPALTRRRPRDEEIGSGVRLFDGCVTLSEPDALRADPALALRMVSAAAQRGAPLLAYARDAIGRACADPSWAEHLRESPEAAETFTSLVATCRETRLQSGSVMRELHDLGLVLAMIPEFSPVVGRVHHDVYHVYTVDVHSVAAVDRLAALVRGDLASVPEFSLATRLAAEIARPKMLFFATLLHDVGKAIGGTDHSQRGAEMARGILARLGLPAEDVDEACHLVQKHLVMYHVATRRDLDDPATLAELAREVHGREGLRDLYLLTVADLSTTSPTSMTSWKARMLDELFLAADGALAGRSDDGRVAKAIAEVMQAADAEPSPSPLEAATRRTFLQSFVASMPERYVLANAPSAVAAHAELARHHDAGDALAKVALVPSRHPEAAEICVVAADRPGLLASITAAIAASRLEVHAAQIHTRSLAAGGVQAVDLFWVRDRGEGPEGVHRALNKLQRDLNALLGGSLDAKTLVSSRSTSLGERPSPRVRTQVKLDDRASPTHTIVEILTRDRPGLLFTIADCLYRLGLSIAVAKINTEGTRVADVFYVTEADGAKVALGPRSAEVHAGIVGALEGLEGAAEARP